jgi:hypothetical protein
VPCGASAGAALCAITLANQRGGRQRHQIVAAFAADDRELVTLEQVALRRVDANEAHLAAIHEVEALVALGRFGQPVLLDELLHLRGARLALHLLLPLTVELRIARRFCGLRPGLLRRAFLCFGGTGIALDVAAMIVRSFARLLLGRQAHLDQLFL